LGESPPLGCLYKRQRFAPQRARSYAQAKVRQTVQKVANNCCLPLSCTETALFSRSISLLRVSPCACSPPSTSRFSPAQRAHSTTSAPQARCSFSWDARLSWCGGGSARLPAGGPESRSRPCASARWRSHPCASKAAPPGRRAGRGNRAARHQGP